jgi:hypothetical protein
MNVLLSSRATEPAMVQSNDLVEIDPRLAFLQQASARCTLVEMNELPLDTAFGGLIEAFSQIVGFPVCEICGAHPCTNESFCQICELIDQRLARNGRGRR